MTSKRTFLSKDIFKNIDSNDISKKSESLKGDINDNNINNKIFKKYRGIDFITEIIKEQNKLLLTKISKERKINLDELKRDFLKVTYYTPTILRRETTLNQKCKHTLKNLKKKLSDF